MLRSLVGSEMCIRDRFQALLPDCAGPHRLLSQCRERVALAGSGHCCPQVQCLTGCLAHQRQVSNKILTQCGGGGTQSHEQLQRRYTECCAQQLAPGENERERQVRCLEPLKGFLECAHAAAAAR
eukprot:TRINITY_DN56036_c0_g1_i1.p2 TRINITY_DN56036_c0_g1~~TRINITY_DN56036_c0_g1_i1.p2  ORF type:complete len:125 (+),score=23.54 TRINITY_DN56036_c0_g1_i1:87-461(+)